MLLMNINNYINTYYVYEEEFSFINKLSKKFQCKVISNIQKQKISILFPIHFILLESRLEVYYSNFLYMRLENVLPVQILI
jgi:hypothetical protein